MTLERLNLIIIHYLTVAQNSCAWSGGSFLLALVRSTHSAGPGRGGETEVETEMEIG